MSTRYRHPLATHAVGTVLGHRRDGRPIYAIAGGDGTGEGGAPGAPAPAAPAPAVPAAPPAPAAPAPVPAGPAPGAPAAPPQGEPQDVAGLPQWAQDHIRSLRTEAADYRTRAQGQPQAPATPPQEPAAPAADGDVSRLPQWAQRIVTDSQATARQAAVQAAVYTTAATAGADPAALLDSTSAMAALAAVDPADPAAVTAAITAAVTANPRLAAKPGGPARGGTDFGGTPPPEQRPANLQDAIAARLAAN